MSYLKLPKTCQDHAVGFQSVNQAIDNNDAMRDLYLAKHSLGVNGNSPYGAPTRAIGRHDDILIARTVADFTIDLSVPTPVLLPHVSGPILGPLFASRLGTGQWQIFMSTAALVGAVALMKSSAAVDYKANCYMTYSPSTGPAVIVTTWDIATAVPDDLPFSLIIWSQLP